MGCIRTELRTTSGETGDGDGERQTHYAHRDVDKRGGGAAWRSWCENKLIGGISVAGSVIHTTPYTPGHLLTAVFWLLLWVCSFTVVGFAKQD